MTAATPTTTEQARKPLSGTRIGVVSRDKHDKTRTVTVDYQVRHDKYGKYLHRQTRYHVHDPQNTSKIGDRVEIANCRPVSKTKSWRLVRVLEQAAPPVDEVVTGVEDGSER